jgi:hypothetical protein
MPRFRFLGMLAIAGALLLLPGPGRAADSLAATPSVAPTPQEMRADVPALDAFHEVIMKIWHEAWPKKDAATLRALIPDVQKGAAGVARAELPGILRDKRAAWTEGIEGLKGVVADYAAAAVGSDDGKLLGAAERLHAQFEALVRIVRPALPELDAFHVVLYRLYHYDLPAGDLAAIRATVTRLPEAMKALEAASLPRRLSGREKDFVAARMKLSNAVGGAVSAASSSDREHIRRTILDLHARYLDLAAVFD